MTRDKAIEEIKNYENYPNGLSKECRDYIIKALEKEPILDKIRAEIIIKSFPEDEEIGFSKFVYLKDVLEILDKYKGKSEDKEKLSWLGKNCKDCGNEKCKKLGTLSHGYDCALWQPKVENHSIKTVTNAKEAENYPISEDISKDIEEINNLIFENGQAGSEG